MMILNASLFPAAEGGVLKAGNYSYPFTIRLPPFLPASYEGQHGKVMYWAKAYLDRPWKGDTEYKKSFNVKGLLDLNTEAEAKVVHWYTHAYHTHARTHTHTHIVTLPTDHNDDLCSCCGRSSHTCTHTHI